MGEGQGEGIPSPILMGEGQGEGIPSPILMGEGQGEGINSDGRGEGQGLSGHSFCLPAIASARRRERRPMR